MHSPLDAGGPPPPSAGATLENFWLRVGKLLNHHGLLQQSRNGLRRLRADRQPLPNGRGVQVCLLLHRIVPSEVLERGSVPALPGVNGNNPVERQLLASHPRETDRNAVLYDEGRPLGHDGGVGLRARARGRIRVREAWRAKPSAAASVGSDRARPPYCRYIVYNCGSRSYRAESTEKRRHGGTC